MGKDNGGTMTKLEESVKYYRSKDGNHNQELEELLTNAEKFLAVEVPEKKNFMAEVCMWRDDSDMVKQVRGECKGFNEAHDIFTALITKNYLPKSEVEGLVEALEQAHAQFCTAVRGSGDMKVLHQMQSALSAWKEK